MTRRSHPVKNTFWIGFLSGLLGPVVGSWLFYLGRFSSSVRFDSYSDYISQAYQVGVISEVLALGGILNLGIFFLMIQLKWYWSARAVIIATLLHVVLVIVLRFI